MGCNRARGFRRWGGVVASLLLTVGSAAAAQRSDYCNKIRARAIGDAAVLVAPRLVLNALRFPGAGAIDIGPTVGNRVQLRVGGSFAPLDAVRGALLLRASDVECRVHEAGEDIRSALDTALISPQLPAFRAEVAFLERHQAEWEQLLEHNHDRLSAHVINLSDMNEFRHLVGALEQKLAKARSATRRLEANRPADSSKGLDAMAKSYVDSSNELERRMSAAKELNPWGFKINAAAIPAPRGDVDWAGWIDVSYSLGGPVSSYEERKYLAAREAELRDAPYEMSTKIADVKRRLDAEIDAAKGELAALVKQIDAIEKTRSSFATAVVAHTEFAQDSLALEQLSAEADRVYLSTLLGSLNATRGGAHGSP